MSCDHCGKEWRRNWGKGRERHYCGAACRMAAMRERKRKAGLIPRAPWTDAGRDRYYGRQESRNKYPNPNTNGRSGLRYVTRARKSVTHAGGRNEHALFTDAAGWRVPFPAGEWGGLRSGAFRAFDVPDAF